MVEAQSKKDYFSIDGEADSTMAWEEILEYFGGAPVYLLPRDPHQPALLVLHDGGVALAEPLYDKIVPVLEWIGRLDLVEIFSIGVGGSTLFEPLKSIVIGFNIHGIPVTAPIFILSLVIAGYIAESLHKHVHRSVGAHPTAETAHEILMEYFGTDLIF